LEPFIVNKPVKKIGEKIAVTSVSGGAPLV